MDKEKKTWLESIGAKEFPEPVKFTYTFPGYIGAFSLSENYIEKTSLEEMKAQYEQNKKYVQSVIKSEKSQDDYCSNAEHF